jgi:hypothetical protein
VRCESSLRRFSRAKSVEHPKTAKREKKFLRAILSAFTIIACSFAAPHFHVSAIKTLLSRAAARLTMRDLNYFCLHHTIDKINSSLLVRLDETLPKLVQFTDRGKQRSPASNCCNSAIRLSW